MNPRWPHERDPIDPQSRLPDWLVLVLFAEGVALLIALVTPVTPAKTGSTWTPAELFLADPSYLDKVVSSFVLVNLMIAIIGIIGWLSIRRDRRE